MQEGEESSKSKYSVGHYIALNVTISMKNGTSYEGGATYKGWAFVGINTTWQQGYHYTYILDFSKGLGQDADGNQIISGSDILIKSVTVSKFTETDIKDTNMKGVEDND